MERGGLMEGEGQRESKCSMGDAENLGSCK